MILAFDTSSAACTAALFDDSGQCVARADEVIGRGHSERLVPMIGELLGPAVPDEIIVGVGPGSFTGIRVAIAAAHGLAIGWGASLSGMSSLALIAAAAKSDGPVAVAVAGGHGELFVQTFVEKLMTYAVGRGMEYSDMPTIRSIARDIARDDHRFSSLVVGVVRSAQFQMRMTSDVKPAAATN